MKLEISKFAQTELSYIPAGELLNFSLDFKGIMTAGSRGLVLWGVGGREVDKV